MSDVMMRALQMQVESLTRQVETLAPENERVRKLLTEFYLRHTNDQTENQRLRGMIEAHDINPDGEYIAKGGLRVDAPKTNGHKQSCECSDCNLF